QVKTRNLKFHSFLLILVDLCLCRNRTRDTTIYEYRGEWDTMGNHRNYCYVCHT
ncbi:hypothetical protein L9F63_022772, partial [Diploptera punctata]